MLTPDLFASASLDATLLQAMLDAIPARVVAVDREHRIFFVNSEAISFTRLPREQIVGRLLGDVVGDAYESIYRPLHARIFERGETVRIEGWVEYPQLGARYVQEHFFPYAPGGGAVQAAFVFIRDLTELKRREAELAAKVAVLEATESIKGAIVDHAQAAVVVADGDDRLVEFNPAAELMFGRRRAEAIGLKVEDLLIPPRYRELYVQAIRMMRGVDARHMLGRRMQRVAVRADGSEFPIDVVVWVTTVNGSSYLTASVNDLTATRAAAEQIERQREQLRQSEKLSAMGGLLAGVAHELNNPLAIVMGRASLLEDKVAGSELQADVTRIREAAERCGRIVRTFLNMARSRPVERRRVQLNDLVRAAAEMLAYTLRSHAVEVSLQLAPALPEIQADADQLGQVVLNLLVNAQQAVSAHEGQRRIRLATRVVHRERTGPGERGETGEPGEPGEPGEEVLLIVSDSGPGVPETLRERIFDAYFSTKSEGQGTGLGLSVSRSIAREHGGELSVSSSHGGGARFELRLPVHLAAPAAAVEVLPVAAALPEPTAKVLVVDDEEELAALMRAFLESAGYEVMTAESGAVALQLLTQGRFDAIVSDLRMRDIDGAALWREVKQRQPRLAQRMLFVTGDSLSLGAQRFLVDTGCSSLEKPFSKADLLARVRALLQG